jgi:hypothetical protein
MLSGALGAAVVGHLTFAQMFESTGMRGGGFLFHSESDFG